MATGTQHSMWSGFYKKTIAERQKQLQLAFPHLFSGDQFLPKLEEPKANAMIENCIGTTCLPIGLALNFVINQTPVVIPMVIEEPSVVAAVSGAAKLISASGGFEATCNSSRNIIYAQVQLLDIKDENLDNYIDTFGFKKQYFIDQANEICKTMKERGGGVVDITLRKIKKSKPLKSCSFWLVVHFHIDVCDSMGANVASNVAEGMAPFLQKFFSARAGFRIVSNLNPERLSKASFKIPIESLAYKGFSGVEVANRIIDGYEWAADDPYRAVTHNKGIMNGIDAVAIATGQDWRAIEAACHAWASREGYKPLTSYRIERLKDREYFIGELELPMMVGTKGGVLKTNPAYVVSLGLMNNPNSVELTKVLVCVGLAQNFAAMRSLATEGIQKGHMALHAQNIAVAAGAPTHAIPECVNHMIETNRISRYGAIEYLDAHNLQGHLAGLVSPQRIVNSLPPSMFYFEDDNQISKQAISINIAFKTYGTPINVLFTQEQRLDPELEILFGDKSYKWVNTAFEMLDRIKLVSTKPERSNLLLTKKLKVLSILLNIVTRNLYRGYPEVVAEFLKALLTADVNILNDAYELTSMKRTSSGFKLESNIPAEPEEIVLRKSSLFKPSIGSLLDKLVQHNAGNRTIEIGLPLLLAIWQVFECRVLQWVGEPLLIAALLSEQRLVMASIFTRVSQPPQMYQILSLMGKRLQTTLFLFCDAVRFESAVTNRTIEYLSHVGRKLEVEQTIIRDLSPSRLARDLQNLSSGVTIDTVADFLSPICNSFLYSLAIDGNISKLQSAESPEFTSLKREFYHKFTPKHEDIKRSEFDVEGLLSASDLFMAYYNVAELQ